MVQIIRKNAFMDLFRAYRVLLDGKEVGRIKNGKQLRLEVPSGIHHLQLKIDWCYSNKVEFEIEHSSEFLEFECGNNYTGKRVFLGVLNVLGSDKPYLWLKAKNQ